MGFIDEIRGSYRSGSLLIKLIYINVAVFVVIRLLQAFYSMSNGIASQESYPLLQWISVPSDPLTLLQRPWTLFTYMFVHYDFLHVLFNLLCLYWFGKVFMIFFTGRQLFTVYVVGGIAGAVAFLIGFNYIPVLYRLAPSSMLLGASASALAVLFAAARYSPDFRLTLMFIGEVRLKYIALVYFVIDLISIPALANTGGHLAHLGGALAGLLAGYYWSKYGFRRTSGAKSQSSNGGGFFDGVFRKKAKMKVAHRRPLTDMEYNAIKNNRQREVDRILEKVKASGYDSLTREEKKTLFDASQEL